MALFSNLVPGTWSNHASSSSTQSSDVDSTLNILLAGKTGSGKSTLVLKVLAVGESDVEVERYQAGGRDLDRKMVLPSLRSLRLHESKGLQNGSSQALEAVKDFVESRKSGPAAGRLHAIWYCVEAPAAGGRAFEAGDITLLESLKKSGNKVPVIIVFTKFDRVEFREQRRLQNEYIESGMDERQAVIKAKTDSHSAALKTYHKTCVASLKSNLPSDAWTAHCAISSKHKESILSLVGLTTSTLAS